jgi:hypothetical protein
VSLGILQMRDSNMIEMSATCHDRSVPHVMIEECHVSSALRHFDTLGLRYFDIFETLTSLDALMPMLQSHSC